LFAAVDEAEPDAVLMVGLAGSRGAVTPERQGFNEIVARIPDNEGCQPQNEPVVPGGPEILFSTLPVEDMTEAIQTAGVPARLSDSAGRFVCNALLYSVLYRLEQADDPVPAAFIHVPATPELGEGKDWPTLTLDEIVTALTAAIQAI
jgi:pyroglutamyl-peptidase